LIPTSTALLFPESEGTHAKLSSLYFTKVFDGKYVLQAGRFNMVDLYSAHPFTGGEGIDRFMNLSLDAPPVSARSFSRRLTHARRIQCVLADTHALRWR